MLANPILLPAYADPFHWGWAIVAIIIEVALARALLRRLGFADPRVVGRLVVINLVSWGLFLAALARLDVRAESGNAAWFAVLELLVVIVEAGLILVAISRAFSSASGQPSPLRLWQVACVSLCANLVSAAMSLVLVVPYL